MIPTDFFTTACDSPREVMHPSPPLVTNHACYEASRVVTSDPPRDPIRALPTATQRAHCDPTCATLRDFPQPSAYVHVVTQLKIDIMPYPAVQLATHPTIPIDRTCDPPRSISALPSTLQSSLGAKRRPTVLDIMITHICFWRALFLRFHCIFGYLK